MEYGYTGKILKIDLTTRKITSLDTANYSDRFLGGRGIAAKIYWDLASPGTKAFDPENLLIFITGPIAGFTRFSGCRWQICGKAPHMSPDCFSYANVGGSWGSWLKYVGYDGLVITGKSERPVFLYLDNQGKVEFRDASYLWGQTNLDTHDMLQAEFGKDARIFSIGPAGENRVYFASAMTSDLSIAGGGLIGVMGSKNLKALVIKSDGKKRPAAAHPEQLEILAKQAYEFKEKNYDPYPEFEANGTFTPCYGCMGGSGFCNRRTYKAECGRVFRAFCQAPTIYVGHAKNYSEKNAAEIYHLATQICDNYGLDTMVIRPMIDWLQLCYQDGILTEKETGLPLSQIGSIDFIVSLVKKISFREGFGDILANGTIRAAKHIGKNSEKLFSRCGVMTKDSETMDYDPRLLFANALINATEPRKAIQLLHATAIVMRRWVEWYDKKNNVCLSTEILRTIAEKYWGSVDAADLTSYTGKALAAKKVQDYAYVKESLILCDFMWPIHQVRDINPDITYGTFESRIASAITGRELDAATLLRLGERVFNLQRMILLRDGWACRQEDTILDYLHTEPLQESFWNTNCIVPDKNGNIVCMKGSVVDRNEFEKMKDEYYTLRGWDVNTGVPTKTKLDSLGLADISLERM